ncbi:hypothetical protein FRC17_007602, partial [Serendipita sp. 399]
VLEALEDPLSPSPYSPTTGATTSAASLLRGLERSIINLSQELYTIGRRYSDLVTSLIIQRECVQCTTIAQLPDDMLVEIFKFVVKDGSHHLGPLLFVDKRFHSLIKSTPILWTDICINIGNVLRGSHDISSGYMAACFRNSQAALFSVSIDMLDIPRPAELASFLFDKLRLQINSQDTKGQYKLTLDAVAFAVTELNWDESDPFYGKALDAVEGIVSLIAGTRGARMRRWKSLRVSLGSWIPADLDNIWTLFCGASPNLKDFDFYSVSTRSVPNIGLFELSTVRNLTISGAAEPSLTKLRLGLLTALSIEFNSRFDLMDSLPSCIALRELSLSVGYQEGDLYQRDVCLPSLRKLILKGYTEYLKATRLLTPLLDHLALRYIASDSIPKVQARYVEWDSYDVVADLHDVEMLSFLRSILDDVTGME